jgi:cystathionine gamma-synthase
MPLHRSTIAVHAGRPRGTGTPLNAPLVPASSFHGHAYAREEGSPGWEPFEAAIGELEGGEAVAFASGMGAISAVVQIAGPRIVGPAAGYAWTRSLLTARGYTRVDTDDVDATLRAAEGADLLWLESPSNPLCRVAALDVLCAAAPVAVDSTFATPLLQRPLALGARFSIHSATKFIGGHSDLLLGVVTARDPEDAERLRHVRAQYGATPGALEAFLALRGLRTLPVRLELAQRTAQTLAERLRAHPAVSAVHYPEPVAFMDGTGAMLAFETAADVCPRVGLFTHAKSLGGVESLIDERAPGLLRLSIGCEHVEDLWSDLEQALA